MEKFGEQSAHLLVGNGRLITHDNRQPFLDNGCVAIREGLIVAVGAMFLMLADTLARTIFAPSEVPVGVLIAFVGGPFFLYLLRNMKRSYTV